MTTDRSERHPVDELADEFVARYRRGERPSIAEYARRFPDLAAELEELLTALVLMEEHGPAAGSRTGDGGAKPSVAERIPDRLGEYRILREIGRGGMGVVYEAVQESLGRHVALKVLPATPLTDSTRLKRFQREGQAAARLHHTNIVPVFGVGESDGVRYYAMQFIAAQSLDRVIDEVRQLRSTSGPRTPPTEDPTGDRRPAESSTAGLSTQSDSPRYYRSVAQLGEQVAEALAHAHRQGILHRDIKPANLLLDARGSAWITDFGLASGEGMEELTNTGDIVGTLRYMAPERLQGKGDSRADVYSLGLTLYELLTLRPAFDAPDRAALVRQITDANPPRPRKLDPRIPRDLETIVLKACEREPSRRYATAGAVAEDLRRFLGNRPIEARRTPWVEQAWRWCRRNPAVAMATSTALAALVIGLGVSLWQWRRADDGARQARENASQADSSRLQAEISADQAGKDFELALDAIEQMLERVGIDRLEAVPHMDRTRRALLQDAVRFYQDLLRGREGHSKANLAMARAHWRLGQIHAPLGEGHEAVQNCDRALKLIQAVLQGDPDRVAARRLAGGVYAARGAANHYVLRQSRDAEADFRQALAIWNRLRAEHPDQLTLFAGNHALVLISLADLQRLASRYPEAEVCAGQAIRAAEELPASQPHRSRLLANALNTLGSILREKGDPAEGERVFRKAVPFYEESARENPEPYRRYELALALRRLSEFEMQARATRDQAEKALQRSLRMSERLIADFPDVPLYRDALATTANQYGGLLDVLSRPADAERMYDQAATNWKDLLAKWPESARYWVGLAGATHNLAREKNVGGDSAGARALFEEAILHQEKAVRLNHREPNALEYLGNHYRDLVTLLTRLPQLQEAEKTVERQLASARELAAKDGDWPEVRVFQARSWENLSRVSQQGRKLDRALQACSEAAAHRRQLKADHPSNPDYASQLGGLLNDWAYLLSRQERWAEMLPLVDEAIACQDTALRARPSQPQYRRYLANHYQLQGEALVGLGKHAAVPPVAETAQARLPDSDRDFSWAILLARCISLGEKDRQLEPDERSRLKGEYADQSMAFLQSAQTKKSPFLSGIHNNRAFAPLRNRPDFQKLLATVPKPKSGK